jgi:hypothetical protein
LHPFKRMMWFRGMASQLRFARQRAEKADSRHLPAGVRYLFIYLPLFRQAGRRSLLRPKVNFLYYHSLTAERLARLCLPQAIAAGDCLSIGQAIDDLTRLRARERRH